MSQSNSNKLRILSIVSKDKVVLFQKLDESWSKYFNFTHAIHSDPQSIDKYLDQKIDILFLDYEYHQYFKKRYYDVFQKNSHILKSSYIDLILNDSNTNISINEKIEIAKYRDNVLSRFKLIIVKNANELTDFEIYKNLSDDIIYTDRSFQNTKWKSIAILRMFWNFYSKPTTIIYKDIIADFIENRVIVNQSEIKLTQKEFSLLKYFLQNRGKYIDRQVIFTDVWNYDSTIKDTTGAVDQIIFKLKTKIGVEYFKTNRQKGVMFS